MTDSIHEEQNLANYPTLNLVEKHYVQEAPCNKEGSDIVLERVKASSEEVTHIPAQLQSSKDMEGKCNEHEPIKDQPSLSKHQEISTPEPESKLTIINTGDRKVPMPSMHTEQILIPGEVSEIDETFLKSEKERKKVEKSELKLIESADLLTGITKRNTDTQAEQSADMLRSVALKEKNNSTDTKNKQQGTSEEIPIQKKENIPKEPTLTEPGKEAETKVTTTSASISNLEETKEISPSESISKVKLIKKKKKKSKPHDNDEPIEFENILQATSTTSQESI